MTFNHHVTLGLDRLESGCRRSSQEPWNPEHRSVRHLPYVVSIAESTNTFTSSTFPSSSLAAVLVLLYEDAGQLRVLLTTRSKLLRTHAGQTALPGGRVDDTDKDLNHTAVSFFSASPNDWYSRVDYKYREAHEEVGLPLDCPHIQTLCTFEPFLSLHRLLVTPVVALLTDNSILEGLTASEGEVSRIFSHPLEALLDPMIVKHDALAAFGSEDWFYENELHASDNSFLEKHDTLLTCLPEYD